MRLALNAFHTFYAFLLQIAHNAFNATGCGKIHMFMNLYTFMIFCAVKAYEKL